MCIRDRDYISVMGLELIVKKDEGFAFVKQMKLDEEMCIRDSFYAFWEFLLSADLQKECDELTGALYKTLENRGICLLYTSRCV